MRWVDLPEALVIDDATLAAQAEEIGVKLRSFEDQRVDARLITLRLITASV